nr:MAG TPA: hypothetical protein [Bacteriophage sp.]
MGNRHITPFLTQKHLNNKKTTKPKFSRHILCIEQSVSVSDLISRPS